MLIKILNFIEKAIFLKRTVESGITSQWHRDDVLLYMLLGLGGRGVGGEDGAKAAGDAGFFKGKDGTGCFPSGRKG